MSELLFTSPYIKESKDSQTLINLILPYMIRFSRTAAAGGAAIAAVAGTQAAVDHAERKVRMMEPPCNRLITQSFGRSVDWLVC